MKKIIVALILALFTTSTFASTTASIGSHIASFLGYIWLWCASWYLGLGFVFFLVALLFSGANYRTVSGHSYSAKGGWTFHSYSVPVPLSERTTEASPLESLIPKIWVVAYPFATFYYPIFTNAHHIALTGQHNLDWKLLMVVFPVVAIVLIGWLINAVENSYSPFCVRLAGFWRFTFNLARYYVLLVPATLLVVGFLGWLFQK